MNNRFFIKVMLVSMLTVLLISCSSTSNVNVEKLYDEIVTTQFEGFFGGQHSVADYEGKIVVLDFWESWCGPCLVTFPGFQKALDEFPDKIVILAATPGMSDTAEDVKRFADQHEYDFIYVEASEMARKIGVRAIPFKIVIAPDGSLVSYGSGTRGADAEYEALASLVEEYF